MIKLLFNIADGQAWTNSDTSHCDGYSYENNKVYDFCDAYVVVAIDGKEVYRTETHNDTSHPIFNEIFETGWISVHSVIEFRMQNSNPDNVKYPYANMTTWKGNAEYYLGRYLLKDNLRKSHENSLIVSTAELDRKIRGGKYINFNKSFEDIHCLKYLSTHTEKRI